MTDGFAQYGIAVEIQAQGLLDVHGKGSWSLNCIEQELLLELLVRGVQVLMRLSSQAVQHDKKVSQALHHVVLLGVGVGQLALQGRQKVCPEGPG